MFTWNWLKTYCLKRRFNIAVVAYTAVVEKNFQQLPFSPIQLYLVLSDIFFELQTFGARLFLLIYIILSKSTHESKNYVCKLLIQIIIEVKKSVMFNQLLENWDAFNFRYCGFRIVVE